VKGEFMVKEFEYKGLVGTDWIGFKFEYEGDQLVVTEKVTPTDFIVQYVDKSKSINMTAKREDLMDHYITQLKVYRDTMSKVLERMR
jgi:hypothetical protein